MPVRFLRVACLFLLPLAACTEKSGPVPLDRPPTMHFALQGIDSNGAFHPVAGEIHIEQRDPATGSLKAEFMATADVAGNIAVELDGFSETDVYVATAVIGDEWYFAPEAVRYFYGRSTAGEQLQSECALQPCVLRFRPNEAIAYLEAVGTVEQFREQFPTERGEKPVFEVTLVVRGLKEQLPSDPCDYYLEDFYFWDQAIDDFFAYQIREAFGPVADCSEFHSDRRLVAVSEEYVARPGFGTDLLWDSLVYTESVDDGGFFLMTQSRLYYVGEELFGAD